VALKLTIFFPEKDPLWRILFRISPSQIFNVFQLWEVVQHLGSFQTWLPTSVSVFMLVSFLIPGNRTEKMFLLEGIKRKSNSESGLIVFQLELII
jgi:hypothetical protein